MEVKPLLAAIDEEIGKLEQARKILAGDAAPSAKTTPAKKSGGRKRRRLSAASRARIAEAQRKRWAAIKKA